MTGASLQPWATYVATGDWVQVVGFTVAVYAVVYQYSSLPDDWKRWLLRPQRHLALWGVTALGVVLAPLGVALLGRKLGFSADSCKLLAASVTLASTAIGTWLLLRQLTLTGATQVTVKGIKGSKLDEETAGLLVLVITSILKEKDPKTIENQSKHAITWIDLQGQKTDRQRLSEIVTRCVAVLRAEVTLVNRPSIAHFAAFLAVLLALRDVSEDTAKLGFTGFWGVFDVTGASSRMMLEDAASSKSWEAKRDELWSRLSMVEKTTFRSWRHLRRNCSRPACAIC